MKKMFVLSALSLITLSMYAMEREETERIKEEIVERALARMSPEKLRGFEAVQKNMQQRFEAARTPEQQAEIERVVEAARRKQAEVAKQHEQRSEENPS